MRTDVRTKALQRAAEVVGGVEKLRVLLGATPHAMKVWMSGTQPPPMDVFLAAVDIISSQPPAGGERRREVRERSRELRMQANIARTRLAATRERSEAVLAAVVAGRLAAQSVRQAKPMSALTFLQASFEPDDAPVMVDSALGAAVTATGADMGTLHVTRPEGLVLVAHRGFEQPFLDYFACVQDESNGERIVIADVQSDPVFAGKPSAAIMAAARVKSYQSTPLISPAGERVGMMSTHYDHPWRPSERELDILDHIARRTGFWLGGGEL